jgi:hypothetical protein
MTRTSKGLLAALAALLLAAAASTQLTSGTTEQLADPLYCTVVTDGQGNPVYTVCVPWPFG